MNEKRPTHRVNLSCQPLYYVLFCGNCETLVDVVVQSKIVAGYMRWCRQCGHETVYTVDEPEDRSER